MMRSSTVAAALVLMCASSAAPAQAQSLNQLGIARLNQDAQSLWTADGTEALRQAAMSELQKLVGVPGAAATGTATIVQVHAVTLSAPTTPGFRRLDGSTLSVHLPERGEWRMTARVAVRVESRIGPLAVDNIVPAEIELRNVAGRFSADLDSSDPAAPKIVRVYPPTVTFSLHVSSSGRTKGALLEALQQHGRLDNTARAIVHAGAQQFAAAVDLQISASPEVMGAGGPGLGPVKPIDLERAADVIQRQLLDTKMPFGTIFETRYVLPYHGTWDASITDPDLHLAPIEYGSIDDSAANTGLFLAALAFKYGATRSGEALADVTTTLRATRILLTMKGTPGNLNRMILPMSAVLSPIDNDHYVVTFRGTEYLASDTMSPASYGNLLLGLSTVFETVDDPKARDEAGQQIEMAVDYLLANNWTWRKRDGSYGERLQGVLEQQYAWVLAAARVNPAKYTAVKHAYTGYADLLWTGTWTAAMDPETEYGKFALGGGALHVVLRLETDPVRWQRADQATAIMRRFIGHHQNALFNSFYLASDPASRARLGDENQNLLTRWLRQPRRKITVDVTSDPTIERAVYSPPFDPAWAFLGRELSPPVLIATYPIPPERRVAAGFMWTASPFRLWSDAVPDAFIEGSAIDFLLPYWMGRYYGG